MAKKLRDIFAGIIPKDLTAEQLAAVNADLDAYEAEIRRAPAPTPANPPPGTPPPAALPPEFVEQMTSMASAITELTAGLKVVTNHVTTDEAARAAQAKAAQAKQYTDHVAKLLADGRITKADHDTLLTPEKQTANIAALDVFIESSGRWPVQPGFKGAPAVKATDVPGAGGAAQNQMLTPEEQRQANLREQAAAEMKNLIS